MSEGLPYQVDELRPGSWRGYCLWCPKTTKKMGSQQKAETAIFDHLRDVHGVDL